MITANGRTCTRCKEFKDFENFAKASKGSRRIGGRLAECNTCRGKRRTDRYLNLSPEQKIKHKERNKKYVANLLKNDPDKIKRKWLERNLKSYFGITIDQMNEMREMQKYSCAICNKHENEVLREGRNGKRLMIDHCHKTNKIRGLLCGKCNSGLGMFFDDIEVLKSAIKYLSN